MEKSRHIGLLDCTLRDGAYITASKFGAPAIKGIIKKMQEANAEVIECGWLKDADYVEGTTFFHKPGDLEPYLLDRQDDCIYTVMIDWDRYNTDNLPSCDGKSVDAVRVVFPRGKCREALEVAQRVRDKGYLIFLQAANTLAYSDEELTDMAERLNDFRPLSVSVVDTFGAMLFEDLEHIANFLDERLAEGIKLGFHSHNNQQLSFALTMKFVDMFANRSRDIIVDASLCGMGRGAGNATTELVAGYLNRKNYGNYDMDAIMDAIDLYMRGFQEKYTWGYSTEYFIAGMYQCHVNNIAYLLKNHRTNAKDMRNIISSLSAEERRKYDYDLLEQKYMDNQNRLVDDEGAVASLRSEFAGREILLVAPGKSVVKDEKQIKDIIRAKNPVVIGVNAILPAYDYDYLFFVNHARYEYAEEAYKEKFDDTKKILLSNIKKTSSAKENETVINFNSAIKRGWPHFDNAVICCLRFLRRIRAEKILLAGFDGFCHQYNESYADESLPTLNPNNNWDELNEEIKEIFKEFRQSVNGSMEIEFVTTSIFDVKS